MFILLAIAFLLCGCSGKKTPAPSGSGHASAAITASAKAETAKPSATPAASAAATGSAAPASASPTASASATPSPAPTPTPSPTDTPEGTIVDGWVVGIPDYVPKFGYGTLDKNQSKIVEGSVSSVFNLCFKSVGKKDLDAYAGTLKNSGYIVAVAEIGATYTLTASLDRDMDTATLVITLSEAEGVAVFTLGAPV